MAVAVALVAFAWSELALNATFHWFTVSDGVFGKLGLPESFHFVLPASIVSWGLFFVLGAGDGGFRRSLTSALSGTVAAVVVMVLGPALADSPDFWGLAVAIGVAGAGLVLLSATRADDLLAAGPAFVCGATVLLWWFVTGLDGFVPDGKGPHTVEGLAAALTTTPLAAGTGAFGGLMSTSWAWAAVSAGVSLAVGAVLGIASLYLAGLLAGVQRPTGALRPQ